MKCSRLRPVARRPFVENLESRLQPGSMITGSGYGWSLLADNLLQLDAGATNSSSLVSQSSSESVRRTQTSAPAHGTQQISQAPVDVGGTQSDSVQSASNIAASLRPVANLHATVTHLTGGIHAFDSQPVWASYLGGSGEDRILGLTLSPVAG